ncbi:putative late blight resistance protein homolog R1B-8 [Nicotiana tabacum]|uniref:Late blight resistance protein homolog R1B-8 n=1 Tax=Nicotiana tabacum TaxID=4097 RepID=A0AC58TMP2_TOBAC
MTIYLIHESRAYFASYRKDRAIAVEVLKSFWRAEGFAEHTDMNNVEEVMDVYLDNLISSSLVISFNEIGNDRTCQIHDLVHEFCLIKVREEKLFDLITSSAPSSSSSDLIPRQMTIEYDKEHFGHNNFVLFDSKKKRHSGEKRWTALVLLPTIWNLVKLGVLDIDYSSFFDLNTDEPILVAADSKLENMRGLSGLKLSYSKDTWDIFKRFPNLQELDFFLKESWFPKLNYLNELEILVVTFESSNSNDSSRTLWDFHFPLSVKILGFCKFPLTSDSLSTIGRLPKLENLFLVNAIIEGEEWNMGEEDIFQKLKCLTLRRVTLAKWEVWEESFPVFEKLQLWKCRKHEEIPPSFGDICSLKSIKLWRSPQLEAQDVEDMTGVDWIQRACKEYIQLLRLKMNPQTAFVLISIITISPLFLHFVCLKQDFWLSAMMG